MKILSMTATFGKLERSTLTLEQGLNIIEAPNEWGKSTWCAFLEAMLYGVDSGERDTKTTLAAKNHYAPWSGAPMSGRMEILWQDRRITLERSTKGRNLMRQFRAYETDTGLEVPELTADNCGQMLLGVERSVFLRSAFLRLSDLPVTQDEALRTRLNALVTTGDESGTATALAQQLREIRNRCRANRSNGLLPQAEQQRLELEERLRQLRQLQTQYTQHQHRQTQLEEFKAQLENHKDALEFNAAASQREKLAAAQIALQEAQQKAARLEQLCNDLPEGDPQQKLALISQLREEREALQMEAEMLPREPEKPEIPPSLRDAQPQAAREHAQLYAQACREEKKKLLLVLALVLAFAGIALLAVPLGWTWKGVGTLLVVAGMILYGIGSSSQKRAAATARALSDRYGGIPAEDWEKTVQKHIDSRKAYEQALSDWQKERQELEQRRESLRRQTQAITGGESLSQYQLQWTQVQQQRQEMADALREKRRREELVHALSGMEHTASAPRFPDTLNHSLSDTIRLLSDCGAELRQLQRLQGLCQGHMETLGSEEVLEKELSQVKQRITSLEDTLEAIAIAQDTLQQATLQLQRRFAPRISQQAQKIMEQLTDGRYDRLTLGEDFSLHSGAREENTLHTALWRSDGTADQLYLALRLAVARELLPQAPLILDDALVRFDDRRLRAALEILKQEAQDRQILLFTCQSREKDNM